MEQDTQRTLELSLSYDTDVLEFISHNDGHNWIYFNGCQTDCRYPRHLSELRYATKYEIYRGIVRGRSNYNQIKIKKFFQGLIPENFL